MRRLILKALTPALLLFTGCEALNDAFVRQSFKDGGLSDQLSRQIRERLEGKTGARPVERPRRSAPGVSRSRLSRFAQGGGRGISDVRERHARFGVPPSAQ